MNRRFLWTFLLALLLPLAQVAAAAHELSHVAARVENGSKQAPLNSACDLCAVAAAVTGGAAPMSPQAHLPPPAAAEAPTVAQPAATHTSPFVAFLSRAPPAPSH